MDQEQKYRKWLINWQPKHANVNFKKNAWQEVTLNAYMDVLKHIVEDLKIDDEKIKKNLFDYHHAKEYTNVYKIIMNHQSLASLKYYPIAKKSLKRYQDFLFDQKI